MKKHPNCSHKLLIPISSGCHDLSSLLLTHSWFTHSVPVGSKTCTNPSGMAVWTTVEAAQTEGGSNWNPRQTIPQNCEQKQMQGSSCVYNWFSRAASCCQSLSNKLSPGALVLINHGASDAPAPPFFTGWHHPEIPGSGCGMRLFKEIVMKSRLYIKRGTVNKMYNTNMFMKQKSIVIVNVFTVTFNQFNASLVNTFLFVI